MTRQKNKKTKCYIIAEAGVNHNGSIDMAKQLIDIAANAGADAVKFQTFKAEKVVSKYAPKAYYQKKTTAETETQLDMIKKLELDESAHSILIEHCHVRNIEFLSTPFDFESIDLLARKLNLQHIKIPSGEITNGPYLLCVAQTGKPVILSTGMSTLGEVEMALGVLAYGYLDKQDKPSLQSFQDAYCSEAGRDVLKEKVTLLHCTTEYPAPFEDVNLCVMETMRKALGLPVGLSDHTPGIAVPIAAVALGAAVIEKHFTLDRNLPGPDHKASLEPNELKAMVTAIRQVETSLGNGQKIPTVSEWKNREIARKSIVAAGSIKKGDLFAADNIAIKRPGDGLTPTTYWTLLGRPARKNYDADEMIDE
ncbi:N-acetylneuraminate synthase [Sulfuricurvum sp. IAE1]|uniref:N-acetylneuraminate synthase n=1 Tax=Sulfuricurvum sp. IAE1 TaxID=2546102 RepID=UPI00104D8A5D|nr:N-acetylneuraminate synthase [Sulfuricurvum sp. IAE1]TDA65898.1 N-acetylneuraminate synthase [Sulfuricurvum sp. IAE1]